MQGAFVQALTYRPPAVLGRQLRPFSAWHGLVLDAAGNAFVGGGIPGLEDTVFAAWVCSLGFADGIEAFTDQRRVSKWGRRYGPESVARAVPVLRDHILAGVRCPEYWQDGSGKPLRAPYWWHLATFARVQLGMSEAAAWDAPVSRLACYRACAAEGEGWTGLKTDEELRGAEILRAGRNMASVAELRAVALLDGKQFEAEIKKIGNSAGKTSEGFGRLQGMIAGAFSVGAVISFGRKLLDTADNMQTAANTFGLSMQSMIGLGNAMAESGIKSDSFLRILGKLQQAQTYVIEGNKRMTDGVKALGISQDEFVALNVDDLLERLAVAYTEAGGSAEAFGAITAIFGERIGPQMIEVLQRISTEGLAKFKEDAEVAAEGMSALAEASDTLEKLGNDFTIWAAKAVGAIKEVISAQERFRTSGGLVGWWERFHRKGPVFGMDEDTGMPYGRSPTPPPKPKSDAERITAEANIAALKARYAEAAAKAEADAQKALAAQQERAAATLAADMERRAEKTERLLDEQDAVVADYNARRAEIESGKGLGASARPVDSLLAMGGLVGNMVNAPQLQAAERAAKATEAMNELQANTNRKLDDVRKEIRELGRE